jgi:hypothetical protein
VQWVVVVVIDHPDVPAGIVPDINRSASAAVIILRRDWEFLFEQLKSTHAVVGYLERVAGETQELGHEFVRYFELARAYHEASPAPLNPALLGSSGYQFSSPLLPLLPVTRWRETCSKPAAERDSD